MRSITGILPEQNCSPQKNIYQEFIPLLLCCRVNVSSCIVGQLLLCDVIDQTCWTARTMRVLDINVVHKHHVINYLWLFHYYFQYWHSSYVRVCTYIKCLRWQKPLHGQIVQAIAFRVYMLVWWIWSNDGSFEWRHSITSPLHVYFISKMIIFSFPGVFVKYLYETILCSDIERQVFSTQPVSTSRNAVDSVQEIMFVRISNKSQEQVAILASKLDNSI